MEKAQLLEKKRREQEDRRRKQEELDQILLENRRKVMLPQRQLCCRARQFWRGLKCSSCTARWSLPRTVATALWRFTASSTLTSHYDAQRLSPAVMVANRWCVQVEEAQLRAEQERNKRET